jgi:hypothetical protein
LKGSVTETSKGPSAEISLHGSPFFSSQSSVADKNIKTCGAEMVGLEVVGPLKVFKEYKI